VRRLRVLCEVARHGSFSGAAASLGYTQPAVSRQIATLEAEVGAMLVRRVPKGAVLTDAGRLLVDRGEAILARLEDAEAELGALAGVEGGRLRIASFASAAASIIPPAIARFRECYPAVELSIVMLDPAYSLPQLVAGELDMALSHDAELGPVSASGAIELFHLFDDPMYVAMPTGHPLAEAAELDLASLATEPWMLATTHTCPDSRLFLRACHAAGFEPQIALQHDDYPAILGFVAAGVGVALIPDMATRGIRADVVVRALDRPPPPRPIFVALPTGYRSPAAAAMLDILREISDAWVAERPVLAVS
ncbi:MAG TPA: LysR family transcriptional regulator, partial [Solirubrobacteraceae bacterium]|jgi:DNA-binding transcriptional LysR family regulator|nr:LysR family transcriptional regulator [Solirubrobacteraceae bacterium]